MQSGDDTAVPPGRLLIEAWSWLLCTEEEVVVEDNPSSSEDSDQDITLVAEISSKLKDIIATLTDVVCSCLVLEQSTHHKVSSIGTYKLLKLSKTFSLHSLSLSCMGTGLAVPVVDPAISCLNKSLLALVEDNLVFKDLVDKRLEALFKDLFYLACDGYFNGNL